MSDASGRSSDSGVGRTPLPPARRQNVFFPLLAAFGGLFAVTILAMLAATAGDPQAPPSRFFRAYGTPLILAETVLLIALAVTALVIDRRQSLAARSSAGGSGPMTEGTPDDSPPSPAAADQTLQHKEDRA